MVAALRIEPVKRTAKPGSRPCGPSAAFFPSTLKLRNIVASKLILDYRACVCPTKPFTEACSFKPVER